MSYYDKSSLVLIPSGTNTGKVFSQKPVSGDGDFTFTRASAATRVNADGNIEKETGNLLVQSNQFDTTWITAASITRTSGQSGYDGTNDAWKLESNGASGYDVVYQNVTMSGVNTYSIYAKAGTNTAFSLRSLSATDARANFDLSAGSVSTSGTIDASIVSVGGGWYRCSITFNGSNNAVYIYPNTLGSASAGNIYIQDAQLEQGLVARDVITTTTSAVYGGITDNTPRLDYTDSSCPALLLEPLRTNLIPSSEDIDSAWSKLRVSVENNNTTSPEGFVNAGKTTATAVAGTHASYDTLNGSVIAGNDYFISCFVKKATTKHIRLNEGYTGAYVAFNFDDQTTNLQNGASDVVVEEYANGWYRLGFKFTADSSGNSQFALYINDYNNNSSYIGSGESVYFWGAQLEAGSYATSYIPTYGSSVSRVGDACVKTGISSLIGQTEGTIFYEVNIPSLSTAGNDVNMTISDGTSNNAIYMAYYNIGRVQAVVFLGGSLVVNINLFGYGLTEGVHKFALAYKNNDYNFFIDGASVGTDISAGVPATNQLSLVNGAGEPSIRYRQSLLFKTRLTNAELATLTTI